MHRPKHYLEYALLRAFAGTVNALPQSLAYRLGSSMAALGIRAFGNLRTEAERRIRQVMGDEVSDKEVQRIAAVAFRDLVWHTIETLRVPKMTTEWIDQHAVLEEADRQKLESALAHGKGAIIAVPHLANWDLAGVGLQFIGFPMTFLMKAQTNPLFDQYLNQMREHLGSEVLERDDRMLLRKVIRSLKQGNVVAILVDLRARRPDLEMSFLGHTADLMRGVGLMAHVAGCPVLPAFATRLPDYRHSWNFRDAVFPDPDADRNEDAERILKEVLPPLEQAILATPDQYFWFNKTWVLDRLPIVDSP